MQSWLRWVLVMTLVMLASSACAREQRVPEGLRILIGSERVVLLSTTWCGYCKKLRADLDAAGVSYREWDTEQSEVGSQARARLGGGRTVPVTIVGDEILYGYQPDRIIRLAKQ
ncbi:MAG: hypothetical protein IPK97_02630 [Ahniella sp.]|nr:hypothetical protein [Ahniella sp.]